MAKCIMIQGTASNAGKSLLAAGLCRILAKDGYSVAPFKSQNMALNSYITENGLEMGSAQMLQALAAGKIPDARMNPVLLKPTGDSTSKVIVLGKTVGTMPARDYYAYKNSLIKPVLDAYKSLCRENDIIVIEGAGSPAEINLKQDDFVNMGFAKMVGAPVLLAGDIDRGGVFASIAGTNLLFDADERKHLKGIIINKFRGDVSILAPGLKMLEDIIEKPVVGVVPYIPVDLDDEDSLSERLSCSKIAKGVVDIAVIRFPGMLNFTDFTALSAVDGVNVRYVGSSKQLAEPDIVILPGSMDPVGALRYMRENGLEVFLLKHAAAGKIVFGIGAGYHILGRKISGEELESIEGMGLLPFEAIYTSNRMQRRVKGNFAQLDSFFSELSATSFAGYQDSAVKIIHAEEIKPLLYCEDGSSDGMLCGHVFGTNIHGILDGKEAVEGMIKSVLRQKGIPDDSFSAPDFDAYREQQLNILADTLRAALDMNQIYKIIEEGIAYEA